MLGLLTALLLTHGHGGGHGGHGCHGGHGHSSAHSTVHIGSSGIHATHHSARALCICADGRHVEPSGFSGSCAEACGGRVVP